MEPRKIVAIYSASWNEPDEGKRTALLEDSWADDGVYQDPAGTAAGRAALVAHIGGFDVMFPGCSIGFASGIDVTEAGLRWSWVMRNGDEVELRRGWTSPNLVLMSHPRVAGFFGPLPPPGT